MQPLTHHCHPMPDYPLTSSSTRRESVLLATLSIGALVLGCLLFSAIGWHVLPVGTLRTAWVVAAVALPVVMWPVAFSFDSDALALVGAGPLIWCVLIAGHALFYGWGQVERWMGHVAP